MSHMALLPTGQRIKDTARNIGTNTGTHPSSFFCEKIWAVLQAYPFFIDKLGPITYTNGMNYYIGKISHCVYVTFRI